MSALSKERLITLGLKPILDPLELRGSYQIVANETHFALVKWKNGELLYPGGEVLEFEPIYHRPAGGLIKPAGKPDA